MARLSQVVFFLLALWPLLAQSKPRGGKISGLTLNMTSTDQEAATCASLGMYNGSHITDFTLTVSVDKGTSVDFVLSIFKAPCANIDVQDNETCFNVVPISPTAGVENIPLLVASTTVKESLQLGSSLPTTLGPLKPVVYQAEGGGTPETSQPVGGDEKPGTNQTGKDGKSDTNEVTGKDGKSDTNEVTGKDGKSDSKGAKTVETRSGAMSKDDSTVYTVINGSGIYIVKLTLLNNKGKANINVTMSLEMKNFYGYLSAVDYPALVFYGVMTAIYSIYGFVWIILMLCSYKDLVRLQFWIGAVIILGLLEKTFFVSEYSSINQGVDSPFLILVAEGVSAVKRALARMLLVIVSLGFGTVKPRLGDSLGKVLAAGATYFVFALIDGIVRGRQETSYSSNAPSTVTLALLFIVDTVIFYWIFTSLVATRRALRLRKNFVKLSLYNHFAYTLIFAILATIGFLLWVFIELNFPSDNCLTDWREIWLRDCFWHILFCFILGVVMVLWRPSSNRIRFYYALVNDRDEEEEEEEEQGPNKNFDTVKMRPVNKPSSPLPVSSQAEDDLRWVEENLPSSAVDKALPLILDSDEEVMTTKFEVSKMN